MSAEQTAANIMPEPRLLWKNSVLVMLKAIPYSISQLNIQDITINQIYTIIHLDFVLSQYFWK